MKLAGVLVVSVMTSGFFSPFPLGIRQCSQLCSTSKDCYQINYDRMQLQCEILAERTKHGCGLNRCPGRLVCVVVSDPSLMFCWNRSITETSTYQPILRDVDMSVHTPVSSPEVYSRSLDVSHRVLLQMHKRHEKTLLVLFEISSGRDRILMRRPGKFYSFALMPKSLVHCQKGPGPHGLYIMPIVGGVLRYGTKERLTQDICTDVVGDWRENTIFFVTSNFLSKMKLPSPYKIEQRSTVYDYFGRHKLTIDVIQKIVYLYGERKEYLLAFGYTQYVRVWRVGTPFHRLVVGLGPLFMKTGTRGIKVCSLTRKGLIPRSDIQIEKDISAISVVKDKFVVIVDGTMRVYNTTSLKLLYVTELKYGAKKWAVVDGHVIGV